MMVLDASVAVSLLLPQDVHHATSRQWLRRELQSGRIFVAPLLLPIEVGAAIARRTGDATLAQTATQQLQAIPGLRLVPLERRLAQRSVDLAIHLRLRGADVVYVALADHLHIPLASWDAEHHQRAGALLTVLYPS